MAGETNKIAVNGFTDGLDRDTSKFKYKATNYYDAQNIRVITEGGLSSGSIENIKGTKLDFICPNLPELTYTEPDGTSVVIPALSDLKIIGGVSNFNRVIVFTTAYHYGENGGYYGQIWMFEYDEDSDIIKGINRTTNELVYDWTTMGTGVTNGDITESGYVHLMYNRLLNFRDTNRIKAWIRNESDKFLRLYWVDGGLNQMRSINLAPNPWGTSDTNLNKIQGTPLDTIDFVTTAKLYKPSINKILNGNLPNGRVCYFYRLVTRDGALSTFSPTSQFVDLNAGNIYGSIADYPETAREYRTTGEQNDREASIELSSEKAVEVLFDNLDKNYDYIQVGYIIYQEATSAELYMFPERPFDKKLQGVASYTFIHDGLEKTEFPITLQEFTAISGAFENPVTLTSKDNWLIPANTKASQFNLRDIDPDFDTRAYSFDTNGTAFLAAENGTLYTSITNPNTLSISECLDAINPDPSIYKYKMGGVTSGLGGSGKYVSYSFVETNLLADYNYGTSSWVNGQDKYTGIPFITQIQTSEGFNDLRSPYKSSAYASHARGEKYRYGLLGVDKQGRESFVEWIADIVMPGFDEYPLTSISGSDTLYINTLGIKFDITLPEDIYNYLREIRIVRVNRDEDNMTKLGTGITGSFCQYRAHRLKWKDVAEAIAGFIVQIMDAGLDKALNIMSGGLLLLLDSFTNIKGKIKGMLRKLIVGILTAPKKSCAFAVGIGDDVLKILIKTAVSVFTWFVPVIGGALVSTFGEQFLEHIFHKMKDSFRKKVANISENVYSLNNLNTKKEIKDGFTTNEFKQGYSSIAGKNFGYVISPIHQFDKYQYRYGDKIKIIGITDDSDTGSSNKITQVYHRNTETEMLNRTHSTAALRKWYVNKYKNGVGNDTLNRIGTTLTIDEEKTLDVGEIIIPPENSGFPKGAICNAFLGCKERYNDDDQPFINKHFSRPVKTMGIGDKKHLIKVNTAFPNYSTKGKGFLVLDQQSVKKLNGACGEITTIYDGIQKAATLYNMPGVLVTLEASNTAPEITLMEPRVLDGPGDYLVSYERDVIDQYGGNGLANRSFNDYIEVESIPIKDFDSNSYRIVKNVYNGDTFVGLYGATNYNYYFEKHPGYEPAIKSKKALAEIFPVECPFNFNLREGKHFLVSQSTHDLDQTETQILRKVRRAKRKSKRLGLDLNKTLDLIVPKRFQYDDFIYDDVYHQSKDFKKFQPKPIIDIFTEYTKNRIWRSGTKLDGELIDNWRLFKPLDFIEVDGNFGEIKEVTTFQDKLVFFQQNAFGSVITNEQSAVTDNKGGLLQLATSVPFSDYGYTSTEIGCSHRFGVVTTNSALYFADVLRKKIYRLSDGLTPLSDIKGLNAFLKEKCVGNIVNQDNTISTLNRAGIHGEYYPEQNLILFTFANNSGLIGIRNNSFTVGYNNLLDKFESFYSFTPGLYIRTPNRVITSNLNNEGYQLFKGNYGEIFGTYRDSYVTILTNSQEAVYESKAFNNMTLYTEVYSSAGANIPLETINSVRFTNDYQDSGTISLTPATGEANPTDNNIIRKERQWFLNIARSTAAGANVSSNLQARMRDMYQLSKLSFTNNDNKRFILHDVLTHYSISQV